jgi:hypothetical protein
LQSNKEEINFDRSFFHCLSVSLSLRAACKAALPAMLGDSRVFPHLPEFQLDSFSSLRKRKRDILVTTFLKVSRHYLFSTMALRWLTKQGNHTMRLTWPIQEGENRTGRLKWVSTVSKETQENLCWRMSQRLSSRMNIFCKCLLQHFFLFMSPRTRKLSSTTTLLQTL